MSFLTEKYHFLIKTLPWRRKKVLGGHKKGSRPEALDNFMSMPLLCNAAS
jgi:hypothetical protein